MSTYKNFLDKKGESRWQKVWEKTKAFAAADKSAKPKYYCLIEFPYPSGEGLHVGHPRSNTALDILARKRRMEGYNVLYPIGFDAFGLPSENYAIKTGIHPAITTEKNIKTFTTQLKALGFSFDWDRVITTTDPKYYKWTQWIFLKMYEHGLAYKAKIPINWCLSCKIGLANEEVVSGKCERCGGEVEKREKEQWMLKITNYADRLIEDLETVDYLDRIKQQQINWIGRSEGAEIDFVVVTSNKRQVTSLKVFTTRPDTLFGATFMVISPEHELLRNPAFANASAGRQKSEIRNQEEVEDYIRQAKSKSDLERTELNKEKTGVELKGLKAVNPATQKEIPIFVADYVLTSYGTGAIMAVPAHDQRDWDFAQKYGLPVVEVIAGGNIKEKAYEEIAEGKLVNSGQFNDLPVKAAIAEITLWLVKQGLGKKAVNYKLRDWVFSRQRYWGEPIPMVYCENCKKTGAVKDPLTGEASGWVRVPEKNLPVKLPDVKKYEPTDNGESPLSVITDWVNTKCPVCGGSARRETDTMPNWAGSNWYFLRYVDPKNDKALAAEKKLAHFIPVDWYNGGMEHTTLHLLYSRFVYKFLYDIGAVPKSCGSEPYKKRTSHGLILGEGGEKMSKSKGNVVNPDEVVKKFGADTFRVYEMFMGPFDQAIPWDTKGVVGVRRFLDRVYMVVSKIADDLKKSEIGNQRSEKSRLIHRTIKKVSEDIETQNYNTAVSALMIQFNGIDSRPDWRPRLEEMKGEYQVDLAALENFLKLLAPFAPHLVEELWEKLGNKKSIFKAAWPKADENLAKAEEFELIIQINGKFRDKVKVRSDITEQQAEIVARQSEKIKKYLDGQTVKNIVFVPGKLINFVI
ncbi:MAG: leucine--tRNA ligase [Candidatus Buchananbacteria bacterium]